MELTKNRIWVILMIAGFLLFYFLLDPEKYSFMPQCLFHKFTGLRCMGCGSQRVVHHLLHGEITEAFKTNALLVVGLPFLVFLGWVEINRERVPNLYRKFHRTYIIITISAILVVWLIVRNIFGI